MLQKPKKLGRLGENRAKTFLQNKGWSFITQNFQTRFGEIDLVFLNGHTVVFVEVKTRASNYSGTPEDSVTKRKLRHLQKAAEIFITKYPRYAENPVRIDVIAIEREEIRHYEGVY